LLEGKNVNLRVVKKEDLPLFVELLNEPEVLGEYNSLAQMSKMETDKILDDPSDFDPFFVEKKEVIEHAISCFL
jgi:hypothetical protein